MVPFDLDYHTLQPLSEKKEREGGGMTKLLKFSIAAGVLHLLMCTVLVILGVTNVWNKTGESPIVPVAHLHTVWALLVGFTAVTAVFHLFVYPWYYRNFTADLGQGKNPWRFLEYGLTASAMFVVIAILCGVQDPFWLVGLALACAFVMFLGWVVEMSTTTTRSRVWTLVAWALLLGSFSSIVYRFASVIREGNQPPGFVYAVVASMFIMFCSFGAVQSVWVYKDRKGSERYERVYLILSLIAKTLLVVLTSSGVIPLLTVDSSE